MIRGTSIRRRTAGSCRCVVLAMCFVTAAVFGQEAGRGRISGTVTDPRGDIIPGAKVILLNPATGVTQRTVTSSAGLYTFVSLNPGEYQVTASQTGFASVALTKVTVNVDQITEADIVLKVGAATTTVTVTETSNLLEPTNSTVGSLIESGEVNNMPLMYRDVLDVAELSAGVTPPNGTPDSQDSMLNIENISVGRPGILISSATINGAVEGSVYYMLDGSPLGVNSAEAGTIMPAMQIPEDGISEIQVETQNVPASYQSGAAGVISMVSKSGTNQLHGHVFGVFRPNALSANEYFNKLTQLESNEANTPPAFHRYQEGAAISGAIKKDKLFYFADYEATQQKAYEGVDYFSVPTSAERTGNFSAMSFTIYDPTQPDLSNGTRQPFPQNIIPNPNPIGLLYLSKMPECNLPSPTTCEAATTDVVNNYGLPGLDPYSAQRFDVRVDWAESEKQHLFSRFSFSRESFATADAFPSGWDIGYATNHTNGRNAIVGDDLTLNPSTFVQLRYSFTRHYEDQGNQAYSTNKITDQGFPSSLASAVIFPQLPFMGFADVGGGVGGTGDGNNFVVALENSDANVVVTKVSGRHQLSTGFEWMKRYANTTQPYSPAGQYAFNTSSTDQSVASGVGGSDYASLLIGMGMQPGGESSNFQDSILAATSSPYYATFIEDTYHAAKNLNITAGLRWDIFGGANERHNRMEYFDPNATNTYNGVSYTGALIYSSSSHRSNNTTNLTNFGPRLAVSWQPVKNLVVRGGAGVYYGPSTEMATEDVSAAGYSSNTNWNSTCYNTDGNTVFYSPTCAAPAVDNFTGPYSLSNPFPTGTVPYATSPLTGLANELGTSAATALHSNRTPTAYNFTFGVDYELPHQVVVSAAFVGSRGLYLPVYGVDLNQLTLAQIRTYGASLCITGGACASMPNQWEAIEPPTNANYGASTIPLWAALQPFPQFGNGSYGPGNGLLLTGIDNIGDSEYDSLQAKVQKRLTSHLTTLANFTWGKIMTDDTQIPIMFVGNHNGAPQDYKNLSYEHAVSPQDVKFNFSGEVSYDLPIGKGRRIDLKGFPNEALGGWTVGAIGYFSTGIPINTPSSGTTPSYFNQRADMTCNPAAHAPHTVAAWFTDTCFAIPGTENGGAANPLVPGTAPDYLDNLRTDGAHDVDVTVHKMFNIGEAKVLRFDASSYNISNTPQFGYPSVPNMVGATQQGLPFGLITNTNNTPRQFQFGAQFTF